MRLLAGRLRPHFAALGLLCSAVALTAVALPAPAHAASAMPAPFVSRALDAVLIPVTPQVRTSFGLGSREQGVLVLSTQPDGVAARSGIRTGDVLSSVNGRSVTTPRDLDTAVYFWLQRNRTDFDFGGWRSGSSITPEAVVTLALFDLVIDLAAVDSWTSLPPVADFSYVEYYEEYYEVTVESYETVEEYFEETVISEEYIEETTESYEEYTEESIELSEEESYEEASYEEETYEEEAQEEDAYEEESYEEDEGDYEDDGGDYDE
jgi:hypothetical protein